MSKPLSVEDLMKPRWKVIADYPKILYHVGDILNGGWRSEDCIYCDTEGPRWRHYPHLFKPLEWWEEREESQMPEYVKHIPDGHVYKVFKWEWDGDMEVENELYFKVSKDDLGAYPRRGYFPATRFEYEQSTLTPKQ